MKRFIVLHAIFWCFHWQVCGVQGTSTFPPHRPLHKAHRRLMPTRFPTTTTPNLGITAAGGGPQTDQRGAAAVRFTHAASKTRRTKPRTTPAMISVYHYCDYIRINCLHVESTGKLCARTVYYTYESFNNYCEMEYVNCREGYDIWQVVHMGACFKLNKVEEYHHFGYHDDFFLDQYYVLEDF